MSKQVDILIIDDEQVIIDSVVKLCSAEGFEVDAAIDAAEGLKKMDHRSYRLIICDIMMPEMDGFQFLEQMMSKQVDTPVIMTTGYSTVENAVKSLYAGAIDFLAKPFTVDELVSSVKRAIRYGEIQEALASISESENDTSIIYVPCPAKYYRLGYCSWAFLENDGSLKIGVTDLFLRTINSISRIELFSVEEEIIQGNVCAHIEDEEQLIHNILAPITGKVIKRNDVLTENHHLMEKDPYFEGWLYTIIPSDLEYELNHLIPCSSDRL